MRRFFPLFLLALPLAAQAPRDSVVPDLRAVMALPRSELAPVIERWQADRSALGRRYSVSHSPVRRERQREEEEREEAAHGQER